MIRVVVTGMGIISPVGNSVAAATSAALAGRSGICAADDWLAARDIDVPVHVAGLVQDFEPEDHMPQWLGGWFDRSTAYALAAAEQALAEAGLDLNEALRRRTGVALSASAPGHALYHRAVAVVLSEAGWAGLPGRVAPQASGNIYSAMLAARHGLLGPNYCVVNACATGTTSMATAADAIRLGRADVMIAGGTDAVLGPVALGSMYNAGALNLTADPEGASCPFSLDRAGLVVGEGAGVLVLERRSHALARGAPILAELLGEALTSDAGHLYRPETSGASWARTMSTALDRAGVAPPAVDLVSAHAPSTRFGDLTETRALKIALGEHARRVPVSATKAVHGHLYGAAGAVETILAIAATRRGQLLPTAHLRRPDPECDLDYVPEPGRATEGGVLLKSSFGFGGTNACAVLRVTPADQTPPRGSRRRSGADRAGSRP